MMNRLIGVLALTLLACGVDDLPLVTSPPPPPPPPAPSPALIVAVSGDGQEGVPGQILPQPFTVRVTDPVGRGVPDVLVSWAVTSGAGEFWLEPFDGVLRTTTLTSSDGIARAYFRPLVPSPGTSTVSAIAAGLEQSPVSFTVVSGAVPAVGVVDFGPLFDCGEPSLFSPPEITVLVGTIVEWVYARRMPPGSCGARLVSQSIPAGGEPFDSGDLGSGQSFRFVPRVAGVWTYGDVINGGNGKLIVR